MSKANSEMRVIRGSHQPGRGRFFRWTLSVAAAVLLLLLPIFVTSPYRAHILVMILVYVIAASSLRTIGLSGQMSLGHAAFMGIGAYTSAVIAKNLGWSPWICIPLGGISAMLVGIGVGIPFARLRAIYFSMVSLFFGIGMLAVNSVCERWTGGYSGLVRIPALFVGSRILYYYFFLFVASASLSVLYRFEVSRIGITWKAIAQSHVVASSVGVSETRFRILALAIGCFFVGIAGAGYAHYRVVLSPDTFNLLASIYLLMYVLVVGIGSFVGPIIGAAVLTVIPEISTPLKQYSPYVFAGVLAVVLFLMPTGIAGMAGQMRLWFARRSGGGW